LFREPDEALDNLHNLATRMRLILNEPTVDAQRATHLFNMTAQFLEQFAWLDESLSNHGGLPVDWRWAYHRRVKADHAIHREGESNASTS
jgi:hypothetical protein